MEQDKPLTALEDEMLLAICDPEKRVAVPYARTADKKNCLYKWEVDFKVAARQAAKVTERLIKEKDAIIQQLRQENAKLQKLGL